MRRKIQKINANDESVDDIRDCYRVACQSDEKENTYLQFINSTTSIYANKKYKKKKKKLN